MEKGFLSVMSLVSQIMNIKKYMEKENSLYSEHTPTSQNLRRKFSEFKLERNLHDTLYVSRNTYTRCFQYKILNNECFLNKKPFSFKKSISTLCYFCKEEDEIVFRLYFYC